MREEDAQNKICPINSIGMYIAMSASSTQRRVDALIDNCKCTASDCMMWREHKNDYAEGFEDQATEGGYCSLAGKE